MYMSAMAGAQRPGRRYTAEEVADEFFADAVSSKWSLNKTMEIIQSIDVFVHFIIFTNIVIAVLSSEEGSSSPRLCPR
jgi:hypothetical protein